jgi:hypothetical protein
LDIILHGHIDYRDGRAFHCHYPVRAILDGEAGNANAVGAVNRDDAVKGDERLGATPIEHRTAVTIGRQQALSFCQRMRLWMAASGSSWA